MALESVKDINIDVYDDKFILINAKRYDNNSRKIYATCYNQGSILNINSSKHSAYIKYQKADGHFVFNFCAINSRGQIIVELTEQMLAVAGICSADLVIVEKGNAIVDISTGEIITIDKSSIISTMVFRVNVYESTIDNSGVESLDEYSGIINLLERAESEYKDVINASKLWSSTSKSYAVGGTDIDGRKDVEDTDNSKYYSQLSKSYATGGTGVRTNENVDNSKYYCTRAENAANKSEDNFELSKSYAVGSTGVRSGEDTDNSKYYSQQSNNNMNKSQEHATVSKRYAVGGTGTVTGEDTDNSKYYYQKSLENKNASEQNKNYASVSATAASASESKAKQYSESASASASSASSDATRAKTAADSIVENANIVSEKTATVLENAEATFESEKNSYNNYMLAKSYAVGGTGVRDDEEFNNAKYYFEESKRYAESSEEHINISANNMDKSEEFSIASKSYAVGGTNTRNNENVNNAKYYYEQLQGISEGFGSVFKPMGTISFSELLDINTEEVEAGYLYNINESFITNDSFKGGAGNEFVKGTNVYRTADNYWDCLYGSDSVCILVTDIATVDEVKNLLGI